MDNTATPPTETFDYSYTREIAGYLAYLLFLKTTDLAMTHFTKIDLNTREGLILELIANNPTASQIDIARRAGMKGPYIVKILDRLTARGLLLREPSPSDRRRHQLRLTKAGEALRSTIYDYHMAGNTAVFEEAGLSQEESDTLIKLLNKLTQ